MSSFVGSGLVNGALPSCYDWQIDMTQEFEKRSNHTCWKSGKIGAHRHQQVEVLHLFRCFTHTHTLPREGGKIKVQTMRWKWKWKEMKMRWRWKWDESYLTRTRRGERKRRGKEQTATQANLAQSGQTLKGQGKRKAEADGHGTRPAEGGKDGSTQTNLPQRNLRL